MNTVTNYRNRSFKASANSAPAVRLASVVPILAWMLLRAVLQIMNWIRFFIWLAIGLVIYSSYSHKRSTLWEGSGVVQS
jgi:APA family basic amino acid/polyamine antiporter